MTIEERLAKLAAETKKLRAKLRAERAEAREKAEALLGRAVLRYFRKKGETAREVLGFARDFLPKKDFEKLERALKRCGCFE
jgi:hypothetical protein